MKNTIERIQDSIDYIKMAINTKYENNGEEAPITDDTLLEDYALAIDKIPTQTVDIGKQLFVFYCLATNIDDAINNKEKPLIEWDNNNKQWNVIESTDWRKSPFTDYNEKLMYAMFVSIQTGESTGENFEWPNPVQLTGSKGDPGAPGAPGEDGRLPGLSLFRIVELYYYSINKPATPHFKWTKSNTTYNLDISQLSYADNQKVDSSNPASGSNSNKWCDKHDNSSNIWKITVGFSNDEDETPSVSEPKPLFDYISNITTKYSYNNDDFEDTLLVPTVNNPIVYKQTTVTTKNGGTFLESGISSQYPNGIKEVVCKYGTSLDNNEPEEWSDTYPGYTDRWIWVKRIEKFANGSENEFTYPIGLRGPAGIQYIASVADESELTEISPNYGEEYIGKLAVKAGNNTYIWYSNIEHPGTQQIGDNYWLNIGSLYTGQSDWNAKEGESGYIKNKTHYVETIIDAFGKNDDNWPQVYVPTSAFNITISNGSITKQWDDIWCISEESLPDGVSFRESYNNTYEFDSNTDRWECSYQIIHQLDPKFVPQMIEISYEHLKELRDNGKLIPGMQYRIIDYETTSTAYNTSVAGHFFDIIVTANSNRFLSEKARAEHSERDIDGYFNISNLRAWEIWYCIDNDVNTFEWADNKNGKGIIYRMIDEFGNDCPYDFKNILYSIGTSADQYTFTQFVDGECYDSSVARLGEDANAKNNIIVSENGYDSSVRLPFIILTSHQCKNNCFGPNCSSIRIENETYISGYKIGADCSNITSNMADNVIIGNRCNNISINCTKPGSCNIESDCQDLEIVRDTVNHYSVPYYINILPGTKAPNNRLFMVGSPFTATYSFNSALDGSLRVVQEMINPDCIINIDEYKNTQLS